LLLSSLSGHYFLSRLLSLLDQLPPSHQLRLSDHFDQLRLLNLLDHFHLSHRLDLFDQLRLSDLFLLSHQLVRFVLSHPLIL
jgi:hypothetical protein